MRVLVTGGGGFIGSHLVESQLRHGHQVRTLDLQVESLAHLTVCSALEAVAGDIGDERLVGQMLEGVDIVYHLASAHLDVSLPEREYQRVNVEATIKLLEAALAAGVRRVVHCSSVGVFGVLAQTPADEQISCRPTNHYEKSKYAGEQAALRLSAACGLPIVVARPAWVYGPRCPRTAKLFRAIRRGRFIMFGDGSTLRHPLYVSDAVRGLEQCAESEQAVGQIYILAGEQPVTIDHLVSAIADLQQTRPPSIHLPIMIGKMAGYAAQVVFLPLRRPPPVSRRSVDFFIRDNAFDIAKAKREIGFQPQVDLHGGLQETMRWIQTSATAPT